MADAFIQKMQMIESEKQMLLMLLICSQFLRTFMRNEIIFVILDMLLDSPVAKGMT